MKKKQDHQNYELTIQEKPNNEISIHFKGHKLLELIFMSFICLVLIIVTKIKIDRLLQRWIKQ